MKKLVSLFAGCMLALLAQAQLVQVVNEAFYVGDGTIAGYPAGATTYRVYAELTDGADAVTAVYAESGSSLLLGTENDMMWNTSFGAITGAALNPAFFPVVPESEYDSFVTIGRASSGDPGGGVTAVSVLPTNAVIDDAFGAAAPTQFNADLVMQDGTWFSTPDQVNTNGVGPNFRVLLAQITTVDDIEYNLNLQVLDGGIGGTEFKYVWDPASIDTPEEADGSGLGLSYAPASDVNGCMDATACNYNMAATIDDGSCVFATGCDTCSGETDGTGVVVDNPEVGEACDDGDAGTTMDTIQADCSCAGVTIVDGCTDAAACNYNMAANNDDGSCVFATGCDTCSGETDGTGTVIDNPEVGEACDDGDASTGNDTVQGDCSCAGQALGCTDATATNYDATAVLDDASCLYLCASDPADLLTVSNFTSFDDGSGNSYGSPSGMGLVAGGNNIFGGHLWNVATSGFTTSDICINIDYTVTGDAADFPKTLEFRIENNGTGNGNAFNLEVPGPGTYNLGGIVSSGAVVGAGFDPEGATPAIVAAIAHFEATPLNGNLDIVFSNLCASTDCGVAGCTDTGANNYDPAATTDDGSCIYDVTLTVDMNCFDGNDPNIEVGGDGTFTTPAVEGPSFGWCGSCVPMVDNGDGTWSVTLQLPAGDFEYKYAHDGFAGQEQLIDDMVGGASCAPVTDFANFANRLINIPTVLSTNDTYGSCSACIQGCTDATACNYDAAAGADNGSCIYATGCDTCSGETDGTGTVVDNPEVGEACDDGLASTINDTVQADCSCAGIGAIPGCTDAAACNYNVNANTNDGSCVLPTGCDTCSGETDGTGTVVDNPEVGEACDDGDAGTTNDTVQGDCSCAGDVLGCTDATATNYDATAVVEDGSCLYLCASDPADLLTVSNFTSFDDGSGNSYGSPSGMGLVAGGNNIFGGHLWNVATSGFTTSDICINIDYTVTGDAADFPKTLEFRIENNGTGNGNAFNLEVPGPGTYNLGGIVSSGAVVGAGFDPEGATPAIVAAIAHFEAAPLTGNMDVVFSNLCASTNCGVAGCTDSGANNYDPAATTDDGSCVYDVTLTVDMNCFDGNDPNIESGGDGTFTTPAVEGPSFGWCGSCVPMVDNGDGTWSVTLQLPAGDFEYKYAHDGFAGQEQLIDDMVGGASCAPVTDFANFANRLINVPTVLSTNDVYGTCGSCAPGCTDMTACNYDAAATFDDGSCVFAMGCDTCSGETDGTGVVVDNPEVGEACDDGDASTIGDTIQADCSCAGVNPSLPQSQLDYPAGEYDLCDLIKADWVGADDYRFVFTPQPSGMVINVEQGGPNTFLQLTDAIGLEVGTTYGVTVDALFGATWSIGTVSTDVTIASPSPFVNPNDVCGVHGPHALGDYISAKPYVCGGDKWEWTFTAPGQLPIVKTRNSSNRFLRLSSVGGLQPGTAYDVTVRAGYPNGAFTPMSDVVCISIVGVAPGGIAAGGPAVDADADLERTEEGTAAVAFYPNPNTGDFLNVNLMGVESPKVTLDIVNMMGASVKRIELNVAGGNVNEVISLDGLASGVYLVNTTMNGEVFTERLIIQK